MQANENENEKPFERVSPDQELQPTYSSSINIKTEGRNLSGRMRHAVEFSCVRRPPVLVG